MKEPNVIIVGLALLLTFLLIILQASENKNIFGNISEIITESGEY